MNRHTGYVILSEAFLTKILDFQGGTIWNAYMDEFRSVHILLEHPDMPEVLEAHPIPVVNPVYTVTYAEIGGAILEQERTDPPKKGE